MNAKINAKKLEFVKLAMMLKKEHGKVRHHLKVSHINISFQKTKLRIAKLFLNNMRMAMMGTMIVKEGLIDALSNALNVKVIVKKIMIMRDIITQTLIETKKIVFLLQEQELQQYQLCMKVKKENIQ